MKIKAGFAIAGLICMLAAMPVTAESVKFSDVGEGD